MTDGIADGLTLHDVVTTSAALGAIAGLRKLKIVNCEACLNLLVLGVSYNKKNTRVPVLSHQTSRVKTYHLSTKREGDKFFTEGGLVNENSNEGGFLFIMNLKI